MNTLQNLIDNGIEPYTEQEMLDGYSKRIGTMNGVYEITDIIYDFNERGRDVTLKCSLCGREIHRIMKNGRNKWSELIKSCPCQKVAEEKRKQEEFEQKKMVERENIIKDGKTMIGGKYGDYKIIDFALCKDTPKFTLECVQCGDIVKCNYQRVKTNAKTFRKCHKHGNQIKFDESYIGKRNNFLKVTGITRTDKNRKMFVCECDCGNVKLIEPAIWEQGIVKSCGCKRDELLSESLSTHGHSGDRLYRVYNSMKQRCYNKNNPNYENYGGRGITVCREWLDDFMNFYNWAIASGYDYTAEFGECTLDRIDVNGNYEPSNCRWADLELQANNKRPSNEWKRRKKKYEYNGKKYNLEELCRIFNTSSMTVKYRMKKLGMTLEQALKTPKLTDGRPRKTV